MHSSWQCISASAERTCNVSYRRLPSTCIERCAAHRQMFIANCQPLRWSGPCAASDQIIQVFSYNQRQLVCQWSIFWRLNATAIVPTYVEIAITFERPISARRSPLAQQSHSDSAPHRLSQYHLRLSTCSSIREIAHISLHNLALVYRILTISVETLKSDIVVSL